MKTPQQNAYVNSQLEREIALAEYRINQANKSNRIIKVICALLTISLLIVLLKETLQ